MHKNSGAAVPCRQPRPSPSLSLNGLDETAATCILQKDQVRCYEVILKQGYDNCLAHHVIFLKINQESTSTLNHDLNDSFQVSHVTDPEPPAQVYRTSWHDLSGQGKLNELYAPFLSITILIKVYRASRYFR